MAVGLLLCALACFCVPAANLLIFFSPLSTPTATSLTIMNDEENNGVPPKGKRAKRADAKLKKSEEELIWEDESSDDDDEEWIADISGEMMDPNNPGETFVQQMMTRGGGGEYEELCIIAYHTLFKLVHHLHT